VETILSDRELALYLRDAAGSAEAIEEVTGIPSARVHLIAQGYATCEGWESQELRRLYDDYSADSLNGLLR
jgi:hypothetical protein